MSKRKKIVITISFLAVIMTLFAMQTFALEVAPARLSTLRLDDILTKLKESFVDIKVPQVFRAVTGALSITVGLFVAWFAYRFIRNKVSAAMRKGKL